MERPKISVIIAVFNAENTLSRCLNSLVAQTLQEIEFICIDDGSTDRSASILDEYAGRDSRFKVFHKDNEGVSATRQFGHEHIYGDFFIHLDSDDYAEPQAYELLYNAAIANSADIVICDAEQITINGAQKMDYFAEDLSAEALIKRMFSWETSALWNRLIRTELITRYDLRFPHHLQLAEDCYFLSCLLNRSIRHDDHLIITHVDKVLIHYDKTANTVSLSKLIGRKTIFKRMTDSYRLLIDELEPGIEIYGPSFYNFITEMAFDAFWGAKKDKLSEQEFQTYFISFQNGIRKYATKGYRRTLVLLALCRGNRFANAFRWVAVPTILFDKIRSRN